MSVRFAGFPSFTIANSGQNVVPVLDSPSYSPKKNPFGPLANGACSMSKLVSVSRTSFPQLVASSQAAWQWTSQ
jgi:hypothetical protein